MARRKKIKSPEEMVEMWLPVKLADHELIDKSRTLSQLIKDRDDLEQEKAGVMKTYSERLKKFSGEIHGMSNTVREGTEKRSVLCRRVFIVSSDRVVTTRMDTKDEIEDRPMTAAEREKHKQGSLWPDAEQGQEVEENEA